MLMSHLIDICWTIIAHDYIMRRGLLTCYYRHDMAAQVHVNNFDTVLDGNVSTNRLKKNNTKSV